MSLRSEEAIFSEPSDKISPAAALVLKMTYRLDHQGAVTKVFNGVAGFRETLAFISDIDEQYGDLATKNGLFCTASHSGADVAKILTNLCIGAWKATKRPSLPAIAFKRTSCFGIDIQNLEQNTELSEQEKAAARAMMLVAARAEMVKGASPLSASANNATNAYHNTLHTIYVTLVAGYLAEKHNALADEGKLAGKLSLKDQLIVVTAALAHDVDHPGKGNPANDVYKNEDQSFAIIKPLLESAGMARDDIEKIHTMLRITSPDGPHAYMKAVAKAHREGRIPSIKEIDPQGKYPELTSLLKDKELTAMAAILSDADLYTSAGAGIEANRKMSEQLSLETGKDLKTASTSQYFLDQIIGRDGFASAAGRDSFNNLFQDLRQIIEIEQRQANNGPS